MFKKKCPTLPCATWVTPSPTDSTVPAPSWPNTTGNNPSGSNPPSVYESVWQTPVKFTFMRTSPALGGSTVIVSIERGSFGAHATAALHVITWPTVLILNTRIKFDGSNYIVIFQGQISWSNFMVKFHDHVQISWSCSNFMIMVKFHDHGQISWLNFVIKFHDSIAWSNFKSKFHGQISRVNFMVKLLYNLRKISSHSKTKRLF